MYTQHSMETYTQLYVRHTHAHIPVYQDQPVQETFGQLLDTSPSLLHVPLYVHVRVCMWGGETV